FGDERGSAAGNEPGAIRDDGSAAGGRAFEPRRTFTVARQNADVARFRPEQPAMCEPRDSRRVPRVETLFRWKGFGPVFEPCERIVVQVLRRSCTTRCNDAQILGRNCNLARQLEPAEYHWNLRIEQNLHRPNIVFEIEILHRPSIADVEALSRA